MKPSLAATGTGDDWLELRWCTQQVFQQGGPEMVGRRSDGHLDSFQIETAPAQVGENNFEQSGYFLLRFVVDRFGRFFSRADNESSIGRARQILSFTCSSS
jgi:hypothetical protein